MINLNSLMSVDNLKELKRFCLNKKVVIFGAGSFGENIKEILDMLVVSVECYLDNDEKKNGMEIDNIKVISFDNFVNDKVNKDDYRIVIASDSRCRCKR